MSPTAIAVVVAAASTCVAALVVATDGALLATDPDEPLPAAAARTLARRDRAHAALSFARLVALLGAGAAFGFAVRGQLARATLWSVIFCAVVVAVAEAAARTTGYVFHRGLFPRLAPVARAVGAMFGPVAWASAKIDARLTKLFPAPPHDDEARDAAAEQFLQVVAAEADVSSQGEALLEGVFSLGETEVHEVMVPRVMVIGIDRESPWSEVVDRVRSAGHARYPVFNGTLDDVVGVVYAKDLLRPVLEGREPTGGWDTLTRSTLFVPATKTIDEQLREFRASGTHMAVVIDEYGGTAGLVTIEDVLEEIVGEIRDEHDEEEPQYAPGLDPSHFWAAGSLLLNDLSDAVGYEFQTDEVNTVGGLVYEALGRVPRAGESLRIGPFRVVVERVIRRRIERVYFERVSAEAEPGAE